MSTGFPLRRWLKMVLTGGTGVSKEQFTGKGKRVKVKIIVDILKPF